MRELVMGRLIELFFQLVCRFVNFLNDKLLEEKRNTH